MCRAKTMFSSLFGSALLIVACEPEEVLGHENQDGAALLDANYLAKVW